MEAIPMSWNKICLLLSKDRIVTVKTGSISAQQQGKFKKGITGTVVRFWIKKLEGMVKL